MFKLVITVISGSYTDSSICDQVYNSQLEYIDDNRLETSIKLKQKPLLYKTVNNIISSLVDFKYINKDDIEVFVAHSNPTNDNINTLKNALTMLHNTHNVFNIIIGQNHGAIEALLLAKKLKIDIDMMFLINPQSTFLKRMSIAYNDGPLSRNGRLKVPENVLKCYNIVEEHDKLLKGMRLLANGDNITNVVAVDCDALINSYDHISNSYFEKIPIRNIGMGESLVKLNCFRNKSGKLATGLVIIAEGIKQKRELK